MAYSISIGITQNSQNAASNYSNVTVTVYASWTYGSWSAENLEKYLKINNDVYYFNDVDLNPSQTTSGSAALYSKNVNIYHDANGNAKVTAYASVKTTNSSGTQTASASKTLTAINKKSTISAVEACALGATGDSAATLTVSKSTSTSTHTITYKCGTASGTVCTKSSSTSVKWEPPASLASQNKTGTALTIVFTIQTFNSDGTSLGTSSWTSKAFYIPDNNKFRPTVSLSVSDAYTYREKYGAYVKGKSKLKITATGTAKYSGSIKSYSTNVDGSTYSTASVTTPVLRKTGTQTITTTVKDSRGLSKSTTWDYDVLNYAAPSITSVSVKRTNGNANLTVTFSAKITSLNSKNGATYKIQYKKKSATSYNSAITISAYTGQYTVTNGTYSFAADTDSSYDILITATDDFGSAKRTAVGPSIAKFWSAIQDKAIAFGKVAETIGTFDVNFTGYFRKAVEFFDNVWIPNSKYIYARDTNGNSVNLMGLNANDNLLIGWDLYDSKTGNTIVYGQDVSYLPGKTGDTIFKPYYRAGDSMSYIVYTAGFVTSSSTTVCFTIPLSKPVIGSPTVTLTSSAGLIVRQENNYLYGSASSTYVKPSSYNAVVTASGIRVSAVMPNTTNVANNNDTIGIAASVTITFS